MKFSERMSEIINKGMAASKEAVSKAGAQAQTWGEMGVLKVEIIQHRNQAEKLTAKLGAEVYATFIEKGQQSLSADSPAVRELLAKIKEEEDIIDAKEAQFGKLGGKESDLNDQK